MNEFNEYGKALLHSYRFLIFPILQANPELLF